MRPNVLLGIASFVLMLAGTTDAEHCTTYSTSQPEIVVPPYYIDNDVCQPECVISVWIYEESNGVPGLQRGDEVVDDTCHRMIHADTAPCMLLPAALLSRRERTGPSKAGAAAVPLALLGATAFVPTADAC